MSSVVMKIPSSQTVLGSTSWSPILLFNSAMKAAINLLLLGSVLLGRLKIQRRILVIPCSRELLSLLQVMVRDTRISASLQRSPVSSLDRERWPRYIFTSCSELKRREVAAAIELEERRAGRTITLTLAVSPEDKVVEQILEDGDQERRGHAALEKTAESLAEVSKLLLGVVITPGLEKQHN